MDAAQIEAIAKTLIDKHGELTAARASRLQQRAAIMRELREIDLQLSECRAAARFFDVADRLPEDDERMELARRERDLRNARVHGYPEGVRRVDVEVTAMRREASPSPNSQTRSAQPTLQAPASQNTSTVEAHKPEARPPVREYLLRQLQLAGQAGAKAAELRAAFQQEFQTEIHEKTVGMTLYRLSLNDEVHRRGHLWFYGANPDRTDENVEAPSE